MKKLISAIYFGAAMLANITASAGGSDTQSPPVTVIAIADVLDIYSHSGKVFLRDQLVSDLIQNYDCCVVSRACLYNLAIEESVHKLSTIDAAKWCDDKPLAADFAVSASFKKAANSNNISGFCWYIDLRGDSRKPVAKVAFSAPCVEDIPSQLSKAIASMMDLPEKKRRIDVPALFTNAVLAVLPPVRFDLLANSTVYGSDTDRLVENMEMALQDRGRIRSLVDRKRIDNVLRELRIDRIGKLNSASARVIGHIIGADYVIMPFVAPDSNGCRVDLHLVQTKTGVIAASQTATGKDKIKDSIALSVLNLLANAVIASDFRLSSANQRLREAKFYLDENYGDSHTCTYDQLGLPYYGDDVIASAIQQNAEAAYLLAREDMPMVYRSAWSMSNLLGYHYLLDCDPHSPAITRRAAYVINRILEPVNPEDVVNKPLCLRIHGFGTTNEHDKPVPLLLRAEALMHLGEREKAIKLAQNHRSRFPDILPARALWIEARCNLDAGNFQKASDLCKEAVLNYGEDRLTRQLSIALTGKAGDKTARYNAIRRQLEASERIEKTGDWENYLNMLAIIEGAQKTLTELHRWMIRDRNSAQYPIAARFAVMLKEAECHLTLGNKKEAARRCSDLVFSANSLFRGHQVDDATRYCSAAKKMLTKIEGEIGKVDELWRTGAEVRKFPDNQRIYAIPLADVPINVVQASAEQIGTFLGTKVTVLPIRTLPGSVPRISDYTYKKIPLFDAVINGTIVPDDAIMVIFITKERAGYACDIGISGFKGNLLLVSFPSWWKWDSREAVSNVADSITRIAVTAFRHSYSPQVRQMNFPIDVSRCENAPCLFADYSSYPSADLRIAMCPACQEEYKKVDFDKIHNDLMDYLKKAGAKIVKADDVKSLPVERKQAPGKK